MEAYRAFRVAFAAASERWRNGDLSVLFPEYAFKPFIRPRRTLGFAAVSA